MNNKMRLVVHNQSKTKLLQTYEELDEFQSYLISGWELQQRARGYSTTTISIGLRNINEFLQVSNKYLWEINKEDVDNFYYSLVSRGLAHSTRRKYQSNISTLYEYLSLRKSQLIKEKVGVVVPEVLDKFNRFHHRKDDNDVRVVPPKKDTLSQLFDSLMEEMRSGRRYKTAARDYVMFKILALLGLRSNELIMLNINDLRFDLGEVGKVNIRYGKGSRGSGAKQRWVPMLNDTDRLLKWYLEDVYPLFSSDSSDEPLFLSENNTRLSRDSIRSNLYRRQRKANIIKSEIFSPHQLRHSFTTDLISEGVDIVTVSKILGHAHIATTSGYVEASSDLLEKRVRLSRGKWVSEMSSLEENNVN